MPVESFPNKESHSSETVVAVVGGRLDVFLAAMVLLTSLAVPFANAVCSHPDPNLQCFHIDGVDDVPGVNLVLSMTDDETEGLRGMLTSCSRMCRFTAAPSTCDWLVNQP